MITAFATHATTAAGFSGSSIASFEVGAAGDLAFKGMRADARADVPGFEYVTDYLVSGDGRFVYATPYTRHPTPCTLHPTPCSLHPAPYTLHPKP